MQIEDLIGDAGDAADFASYFDPGEFALREALESTHWWHVHRRTLIARFLERTLGRGARALELGCGTGSVATYLNERGWHVDYADVHREGLEAAARRVERTLGDAGARRYVRLDVTSQFPTGDYDAVLLFDVLEHLPDDRATLAHVRSHLRAGATLAFSVPAFRFLWSPWDDLQRHKRRYTRPAARALAEGAGFRVERLTYFFFPLFFAAGGVKVLRTARDLVRGPAAPPRFDDLLETKTTARVNRAMLALLAGERRVLERCDLLCGTSLFCLARAA